MKFSFLAAAVMLASAAASAQTVPDGADAQRAERGAPAASDLLFDRAQLRNATAGSTLTYDYQRRSGIAEGPYGPPLKDTITFRIEPGKDDATRTVRVQMFSGANRTPAGPFADHPGNPILVLFLEQHLKGLAPLLGANPRYIKNAIRKGLRERAKVTPTQVAFEGRQVEGWRIVTQPFAGDGEAGRMRGFDTLTYTFVTSPAVPGEIVSIEAQARKADGGELLDEKVSYDQSAG